MESARLESRSLIGGSAHVSVTPSDCAPCAEPADIDAIFDYQVLVELAVLTVDSRNALKAFRSEKIVGL